MDGLAIDFDQIEPKSLFWRSSGGSSMVENFMALQSRGSPRGVHTTSVISPVKEIDIAKVALGISRIAAPILHEAQQARHIGAAMVAGAKRFATLESVEALKDLAGVADTIEKAADSAIRAQGAVRALDAAGRHAKLAGQLGFDLVRMRCEVEQAQVLAREFRSPAAESALVFMKPMLAQVQSAFEAERFFQKRYSDVAASLKDGRSSGLGKAALAAEKIAQQSMIGRGLLATGKLLTRPIVSKALLVIGVGIAGFKGYHEAPTHVENWKRAHGVAAGASSMLTDVATAAAIKSGQLNPVAALYDPAVKYGSKALGFGDAGDKLTISKFYEGCSKSIVGLTQGLWTGDSEALSEVHKHNIDGSGSSVIRGYAMMGDLLSQSSLLNTTADKVIDWYNNVPEGFRTSTTFWEAFKHDAGAVAEVGHGMLLTAGEAVSNLAKRH